MKLLKQLYRISSPSGHETRMINFIRSRLDRTGIPYTTDAAGNIYAVKGTAQSYPCIVSHTDEVHLFHGTGYRVVQSGTGKQRIIYGFDYRQRSHCGTGADDKNGIWICLRCLEEFDAVKCVFFVSEETGCVGSSRARMKFFDDCRFVLQCDRKGSHDMVIRYGGSELCSAEFLHDADPYRFGYLPSAGLITDVITLKMRGLEVSCANLSCGYYLPHTPHEFTCVEDLMNCYRFVRHIVENCHKTYCHQIRREELYGYGFGIDGFFNYDDTQPFHKYNAIPRGSN
jgi:putative aminopeptidase FrvX